MSQHDELDNAAVDLIARQAIQDINPDMIESPALKRLIGDIQDDVTGVASAPEAYNRVHNRHNRGR